MRSKRGDFRKKKPRGAKQTRRLIKKTIKANNKTIEKLHKLKSKFRRLREIGGSFSDVDRSLLLAIQDPNVKEIIIKK